MLTLSRGSNGHLRTTQRDHFDQFLNAFSLVREVRIAYEDLHPIYLVKRRSVSKQSTIYRASIARKVVDSCLRGEFCILQHRATLDANVINALNSRIVIEQAKGMIAEREGLGMDQSFARLRARARSHNLRLVDVAHAVIDGTLAASELEHAMPPNS